MIQNMDRVPLSEITGQGSESAQTRKKTDTLKTRRTTLSRIQITYN